LKILKGKYILIKDLIFKILFFSKENKIYLTAPLKSVERQDIEASLRTINDDRKNVIQAAIVRIMRVRKILKHESLMQEVIQQLSSHFEPKIAVIKVNSINKITSDNVVFFRLL